MILSLSPYLDDKAEGMRLDVELQQQIDNISDKQQLTIMVQRHFLIEVK